jgi:hypothetical protein
MARSRSLVSRSGGKQKMPKRKPDRRNPRFHERTLNSYDRRLGRHLPSKCILIVCEGAETEPNYFESLRHYLKLSTISVKIQDRAGAPINVVDEALAQFNKRKQDIRDGRINVPQFEAVWCVFDVEDPHHNQTFNRAIQNADQNGFNLAVSNPAFEFWYVLHFERTTRPFTNGNELKEYLKRRIPGYQEAMPVFEELVASTHIAIQNATNILEKHPQGEQRFPNPSTNVHSLVGEMIEMSPSGREHLK